MRRLTLLLTGSAAIATAVAIAVTLSPTTKEQTAPASDTPVSALVRGGAAEVPFQTGGEPQQAWVCITATAAVGIERLTARSAATGEDPRQQSPCSAQGAAVRGRLALEARPEGSDTACAARITWTLPNGRSEELHGESRGADAVTACTAAAVGLGPAVRQSLGG